MQIPWRELLLPLLLTAAFMALSVLGVDAHYSNASLLALGALYLMLSTALALAVILARHGGRALGFLASAGVGLVVAWHLRELTYWPSSFLAVPLVALAVAVPIHLLIPDRPRLPPRHAALVTVSTLAAFGVAAVALYQGSGLLRWHLLRHNKMLGTPLYYALSPPVAEIEEKLYAEAPLESSPRSVSPLVPGEERLGKPSQHLVYILLDTLRADALTMGGAEKASMPRLDAFLDDAWRFTDVTANASWTRPSMASYLTGLLPEEHGARDTGDPLDEGFTTLAEVLQERGYETVALVTNVGAVGRGAGFAQGYDVFLELEGEPYARASRVRATLEQWLSQRAAAGPENTRPLFLYLHFLDPHEPYLAGRVPRRKSRAEYEAAYRAELEYLDGELASLFELLGEHLPGHATFVASDHGEEFFEHEEFGHGYSLYREVVHVPVAFRPGGSATGTEVDAALEARDFYDLLTRWATDERSQSPGAAFDVSAWAAERRRERLYTSIYYSSEGRLVLRPYLRQVTMRAVEKDGYKLIWSAYGGTWELYDLERDPDEMRNLAAALPARVTELSPLLEESVEGWYFPSPYERSEQELEQLRALGYVD